TRGFDEVVHGLLVGDVQRVCAAADLRGELLDPVRAPGTEHHVESAGGEGVRAGRADAGARAGDDGGLAPPGRGGPGGRRPGRGVAGRRVDAAGEFPVRLRVRRPGRRAAA